MSTRGYMELCLGAGAVLLALLEPTLVPFCGYMGGKRRLAGPILHSMGRRPGEGVREVVIAEAGPLGWVWSELLTIRTAVAVARILRSWSVEDPVALWDRLAVLPPFEAPAERAAQVLWLQARTPGNAPLHCVGGARWAVSERPGRALQRVRQKGTSLGKDAGQRSTVTVAERVLAIARALSRQPVRFVHGDYADAIPPGDLSGWDIYWDPPYQGMTNYAVALPRERVLRDARDLRDRGATLTISEAMPLPLRRWRHVDITRPGGKPEWLTCSRWPVASQQSLFSHRAAPERRVT